MISPYFAPILDGNSSETVAEPIPWPNNKPKEIEIKRHTLSSLGNLYFDVNYYDEAFKAYRELYKCCITDKDKSVALNSFSLYYCTQDQKDSAIIIQRKALDYALDSGDSSMISISEFNLSISYDEFEEADSAYFFLRSQNSY